MRRGLGYMLIYPYFSYAYFLIANEGKFGKMMDLVS